MKNVPPNPCLRRSGAATVKWLFTESSKVRMTSRSGIGFKEAELVLHPPAAQARISVPMQNKMRTIMDSFSAAFHRTAFAAPFDIPSGRANRKGSFDRVASHARGEVL